MYSRELTVFTGIVLLVFQTNVSCKGKIRNFPETMEFGASSAAYQIKGGWYEDGKGLSIWDIATHTDPSPIKDGSTADVASDSYHLYRRDVEIMKELGLDFYRFSISWPRILPSGFSDRINQLGLDYYHRLIDEMLNNNIKPFATIYNWDLPYNLQKLGGWTNPLVVDWFVAYSKVLFSHFGDRVRHWITVNDPKQICFEGYGSSTKAPMTNMTGIAEYLCSKNVLVAHAKVYHLYDEHFKVKQNGSVGISIGCTWYEAASDTMEDYHAAVDARQFDWGLYAHPIFSKSGDFPQELKRNIAAKSAEQGFPKSRLPELSALEVAMIRGSTDFFGINAYTTKLAYRDASLDGMYAVPSFMDDMGAVLVKDPSWTQAQSAWLQEVPWGFSKLLVEIKNLYNNPPVYIAENGWSTPGSLLDEDRIQYYRGYLNALLDAIEHRCNIKGYAVYSLMDGFEWMQGYTEKFGLYQVDFRSQDRSRTPRKSAYIYKEIIRSKTLNPDFEPENYVVEIQESQEKERDREENDGY